MSSQGEQGRKPILNVNFVDKTFFLQRVREFEQKYEMQWDQFLAEYSTGRLASGRCNADFAEWAFLCRSFMSELLKPDDVSPPTQESEAKSKEPEADSGFFALWRGSCSIRKPTSNASRLFSGRTGTVTTLKARFR